MIALVQRVSEASVTVEGSLTGSIGTGMLILLGVHRDDTEKELEWVARKCLNLRIFNDDEGKMNRSINDIGGEILIVSQFTLYGNTRKGNRPSFINSAGEKTARPLYEAFINRLEQRGTGVHSNGRIRCHDERASCQRRSGYSVG